MSMIGSITGLVDDFMPLIFVGIVLYMIAKPMINEYKKRKKEKKVEKARNDEDRLYIGMKKAAKSTNTGKRTPVRTTGDEGVPGDKIGETVYGVLAGNDEIIMFTRSRWWKIWEDMLCIRAEPELVGDLNAGEIVVKGKALDPVSDRYMYIVPPAQYYDDIDVEKVYERRSRVASLKHKRLLNMDIDEDRSFTVKTALRGDSKKALKEIFMPSKPLKENKQKVKREKNRKADEMQREYEDTTKQSPYNTDGGE